MHPAEAKSARTSGMTWSPARFPRCGRFTSNPVAFALWQRSRADSGARGRRDDRRWQPARARWHCGSGSAPCRETGTIDVLDLTPRGVGPLQRRSVGETDGGEDGPPGDLRRQHRLGQLLALLDLHSGETLVVRAPPFVLDDARYRMSSMPTSCCSMGWVTVFSRSVALAPGTSR